MPSTLMIIFLQVLFILAFLAFLFLLAMLAQKLLPCAYYLEGFTFRDNFAPAYFQDFVQH